jgi:hypothetical protein
MFRLCVVQLHACRLRAGRTAPGGSRTRTATNTPASLRYSRPRRPTQRRRPRPSVRLRVRSVLACGGTCSFVCRLVELGSNSRCLANSFLVLFACLFACLLACLLRTSRRLSLCALQLGEPHGHGHLLFADGSSYLPLLCLPSSPPARALPPRPCASSPSPPPPALSPAAIKRLTSARGGRRRSRSCAGLRCAQEGGQRGMRSQRQRTPAVVGAGTRARGTRARPTARASTRRRRCARSLSRGRCARSTVRLCVLRAPFCVLRATCHVLHVATPTTPVAPPTRYAFRMAA